MTNCKLIKVEIGITTSKNVVSNVNGAFLVLDTKTINDIFCQFMNKTLIKSHSEKIYNDDAIIKHLLSYQFEILN